MGKFPGNRAFAFTIFDDTDGSTLESVGPVYRLLAELGLRTTKSVWPLALVPGKIAGGSTGATLQDHGYLRFVRALRDEGFEIALHGVQNHDAPREKVQRGIDEFCERVGERPRIHTNHFTNRENIYWGAERFNTPFGRIPGLLLSGYKRNGSYEGHVEASPYFWGDICRKSITYVRNLVFDEVNLARINPTLPYHDPTKPFVNFWFTSSEGANASSFCERICEQNQDRLEKEGGICIMYTHFADGFCVGGVVTPRFEMLLRRLARKNGWFVPVSQLLDFLRSSRTDSTIPRRELERMEMRWLVYKMRHPGSR
jgi:hypothetical protein